MAAGVWVVVATGEDDGEEVTGSMGSRLCSSMNEARIGMSYLPRRVLAWPRAKDLQARGQQALAQSTTDPSAFNHALGVGSREGK